ncbi:hypothetical protein ACFPRL_20285 [Pseudoclavibacter helvolus]
MSAFGVGGFWLLSPTVSGFPSCLSPMTTSMPCALDTFVAAGSSRSAGTTGPALDVASRILAATTSRAFPASSGGSGVNGSSASARCRVALPRSSNVMVVAWPSAPSNTSSV